MLIFKSRSLVLPFLFLAVGSGAACSESVDPAPGTGGALGTGGGATGGTNATGGASSGGALSSGGSSTGGASSGGSSSGGAAAGGAASGGAAAGGAAAGGAGAGGAATGGSGPTVAFSEVADIVAERCAVCHVAPGSAGKPNFSTPEAIDSAFSGTMPISQCGNNPLVTVNEPEQSALVLLINGACTAGGQGSPAQMPPMGKIPDAEIQTIEDWVSSGAPGPE